MNNVTPQSSLSGSRMNGDAGIALGLGLTNECNLACAFCYRDPTRADRLSLDQVKAVMERLPVRSVNLGTGENGMHPDFKAILAYLRTKSVKLTITSNGHSVALLEDNELRAFHDIEFSLDYPTQAEQDAQRGHGNWALIHQLAERCLTLRIPVTIIAVMMKSNYLRLADVARVAKQFDAPLRVNVYQAVRSHFVVFIHAKDPKPSQELHSREALAPVFADLNQYAATMHFLGQTTILTLTGDRATRETYCMPHHLTVD